MVSSRQQASKWVVGPPAPFVATVLARLLEVSTFIVTAVWVSADLFVDRLLFAYGAAREKYDSIDAPHVSLMQHASADKLRVLVMQVSAQQGQISNDTSAIFNWHPLLMSLGFAVFMSEAVLAYSHPVSRNLDRGQRKILHASLHTAAIVCIVVAIIATFKSHTLKLPTPTPNLYSPHSYLGMLTFVLSLLQYLGGLLSFLVPKVPGSQKAAYSPIHIFFGRATYVLGLATMAVGIQEKTTFVQNGKQLSGAALFTDTLKIPAALQLLLAFTGLLVLYHHVPGPEAKEAHDDSVLLESGTEES